MKKSLNIVLVTFIFTFTAIFSGGAYALANNKISVEHGAYIISSADHKIRLTPYGDSIIRIQSARLTEGFFQDDHYEMVASHQWSRQLAIKEYNDYWLFSLENNDQLSVKINKNNLAASFYQQGKVVLSEISATQWHANTISTGFIYDDREHFTGLGHGYLGRAQSLDLKGQIIARNYGDHHSEQAPLIVPFYLSSKGYGVFLNSTFTNRFNFGKAGEYSFEIDDAGFSGRMDYFFIAGPKLTTVLDNYTQLTGRPRLPKKSMFGLQLSDKGHDHNSSTPSDEKWWKAKITKHRQAGFPLDHVINDNRWRAAGGKRCESKLAWDKKRYPEPKKYALWLKQQGLVATLDLNRCIAQYTDGWQESFNLPNTDNIDFKNSAPDLTNEKFRTWFWQAFYQNSLDPKLNYPGDALWIDEFDEMGAAKKEMILANGKSWAEMRNYWFFLIAKALVEQGWDKSTITDRPFVWVRGMTAGAQRYATLWSGDILPNYDDMQKQIRAMQLAGLSGFPYWGHDAGGFHNWDTGKGPDAQLYQQWAMAFGSFSPIWKPHGMGESRWPLDRSQVEQQAAHQYSQLRYQLMPYLYNAAHQAATSGIPIARAMLLDYPEQTNAWQYDLQYMWGDSLLIAPNASASKHKTLWLPKGYWYDYHSKKIISGDKILTVNAPAESLAIFVKQGSIIPKRDFALSTQFINKSKLILEIYTGQDGQTELIEDDDVSEQYRLNSEITRTKITYNHASKQLVIYKSQGNYQGAPKHRQYELSFIGLTDNQVDKGLACVLLNGKSSKFIKAKVSKSVGSLILKTGMLPVNQTVTIQFCQ